MKKIVLAIAAACTLTAAHAQDSLSTLSWFKKNNVFQNLDISVTAGTTGIGFDVASKIGKNVQLRAGYEFMPRFNMSLYFPIEIGGQPARQYDANGNRVESRFDRLAKMLQQVTGYEVKDEVEMIGKPTLNNFKFLVDVFPFRNKHWHITAGFYWGKSQFAYAENSTTAMTSLLAVGMFNQLYEKAIDVDKPLFEFDNIVIWDFSAGGVSLSERIAGYGGRMGFHVGNYKHDIYYTYPEDVWSEPGEYDDPDDFEPELIHAKGETVLLHKAGDPYMMEPGADSMVKVRAKSNAFKPYLGFGYGGRLLKNRDDWHVSFDAGMMFWGGTPDLITHDGTNLTQDVTDITGKVGDWVDFLGGIKVYPVLSVRFTKTIF
jgi:hypothetical protein